jgi:hypothetical protein
MMVYILMLEQVNAIFKYQNPLDIIHHKVMADILSIDE